MGSASRAGEELGGMVSDWQGRVSGLGFWGLAKAAKVWKYKGSQT